MQCYHFYLSYAWLFCHNPSFAPLFTNCPKRILVEKFDRYFRVVCKDHLKWVKIMWLYGHVVTDFLQKDTASFILWWFIMCVKIKLLQGVYSWFSTILEQILVLPPPSPYNKSLNKNQSEIGISSWNLITIFIDYSVYFVHDLSTPGWGGKWSCLCCLEREPFCYNIWLEFVFVLSVTSSLDISKFDVM